MSRAEPFEAEERVACHTAVNHFVERYHYDRPHVGLEMDIAAAKGYWALCRKEATMPVYLTCFSYTPETWNALIERPEDRRDMAREIIQSVGGTLHGFWYAFGKYDGYTLWEAPDNVKMASVALALSSRGAIKSQE